MKLENIIKSLTREGYTVYNAEFSNQEFPFCNGTALVNIVNGSPVITEALYRDVVAQIQANKSHIYTIDGGKKSFSQYNKLGF